MARNNGYKIAVWILSLIIVVQGIYILALTRPKKVLKRAPEPAPVRPKARIAIVLDDWGYNLDNLQVLEQIKYPLTVAMLPNLSYSRSVAEAMRTQEREIILHLPMEPHEKYRLEKNTLSTAMDAKTMKNILEKDLASVLYARGVSNHMGSLATEDAGMMETLFGELKQKRLYFLDSFVTPKSVCRRIAGKMNLGFAKRDVFLDNKTEAEYIKEQIYKLKLAAKARGYAVGIGHNRNATLEVLLEVMPQLAREGYEFVFVSDLLRH